MNPNADFMTRFLELWRMIFLSLRNGDHRKLALLLMRLPPVEYLSTEEVAEMLVNDCEGGGSEEVPEGWTLGPAITAHDAGDDSYDCEAQVWGQTLINLLKAEHPEWEGQWKTVCCDCEEHLAYRVLDENRRVAPIACWMQAKRTLLNDGDIEMDEQARREVVTDFLTNTITWILEEDWAGGDDFSGDLMPHVRVLRSVDLGWKQLHGAAEAIATEIYDDGEWYIGGEYDPCNYFPYIADYLLRNQLAKAPKARTRKKKISAASLAA